MSANRWRRLYASTLFRNYAVGAAGFFVGVKLCDAIFYDQRKHEVEVELMEEEFWRINGEPKHIKPELVESVVYPSTVRKSWIQVIYDKDKYITKEMADG